MIIENDEMGYFVIEWGLAFGEFNAREGNGISKLEINDYVNSLCIKLEFRSKDGKKVWIEVPIDESKEDIIEYLESV